MHSAEKNKPGRPLVPGVWAMKGNPSWNPFLLEQIHLAAYREDRGEAASKHGQGAKPGNEAQSVPRIATHATPLLALPACAATGSAGLPISSKNTLPILRGSGLAIGKSKSTDWAPQWRHASRKANRHRGPPENPCRHQPTSWHLFLKFSLSWGQHSQGRNEKTSVKQLPLSTRGSQPFQVWEFLFKIDPWH